MASPSLSPILLSFLILLLSFLTIKPAESFNCISPATCNSIIDYVTPNATTISAVSALFGVTNLRSVLGANNLPASTSPNHTIPASQTIKIPFPCTCTNGNGTSNHRPLYKVVPLDGLNHIAVDVFSRLVTYQQIQAANNIPDPNLILVGQELWIPLPCSCDKVDGEEVVHYGHMVASGSTVSGIAQEFSTTEAILLKLNGLASPNDLKADSVLDVPLKACTSRISNTSLDYPLLVPNGTYVFTADNCVKCNCDAANNFTLQCAPFDRRQFQIRSTLWPSCPSMQCQGRDNFYIGNTSSSSCNRTTCAYAGYTNQTILTSLALDTTCPESHNSATKIGLQGWGWNFLLIAVQLVFLSLHFF